MRKALVIALAIAFSESAFAKTVVVSDVVGDVRYYTLDGTWEPLSNGKHNELEKVNLPPGSSMTVSDAESSVLVKGQKKGTIKAVVKASTADKPVNSGQTD